MSADDLRHQIEARRRWIASLQEYLPYADGLAYSQDKQRIRQYETEIVNLERKLKEATDGRDHT